MFTEFGQSAPKSNLFHAKPHGHMPRDLPVFFFCGKETCRFNWGARTAGCGCRPIIIQARRWDRQY
jgi:hypothetical protein